MTFNAKYIAENIIKYRVNLNMTQNQLADLTSINRKYISRIERIDVIPNMDILSRIAIALNVKLDDLLYENLDVFNQADYEDEYISELNKFLSTKSIVDIEYYSKLINCFDKD